MELKQNTDAIGREDCSEAAAEVRELISLMREHEAALLRYANRLLRGSEDAKDAVQETFIRFVRISQKGEREKIENISAWLYRVARNICLDHLKSKRAQLEVPISGKIVDFADGKSPDRALADEDEMKIVRKEIMELNPRDREVVILKIEHGRSYREIAEIMNLSVSNVGFILHQAMKKIARGIKTVNNEQASINN